MYLGIEVPNKWFFFLIRIALSFIKYMFMFAADELIGDVSITREENRNNNSDKIVVPLKIKLWIRACNINSIETELFNVKRKFRQETILCCKRNRFEKKNGKYKINKLKECRCLTSTYLPLYTSTDNKWHFDPPAYTVLTMDM